MPAPKKSAPKTRAKAATSATPAAPAAAPQPPVSAAGAVTQIVAQIDVGWGNRLGLRGQGAGLSWQKSEPMQWQNGSWVWQTSSRENFEFKVILNERVWQQGFNLQAKAGTKIVFRPHF